MMADTAKRTSQQTHAYSDRSRQSLTSNAATAVRSRSKSVRFTRFACFLVLLVFLGSAGFIAVSRSTGRHHAYFRSRGPFSEHKLRQFGQSASNELQNCTASSRSTVCKWAKQHNRVNRKRPADWEPKEGWPEELETTQLLHHASDRALAAVDNANDPSRNFRMSLQSVLQSLWPYQEQDLPIVEHSSLPQCSALHRQPCIALVGNANVSHTLQPEVQGCMMVRQQDVVTAATCAYSPDIWILDQTSTQPQLTGANQHCSVQQMLANTKAIWYLGGEQGAIVQLQNQDSNVASIPAVHFPAALWKQRYQTRSITSPLAADMQPSPLWIGLLTVLECARPDAQIHVYTAQPSDVDLALHDTSAELELLTRLHASSLVVLHENCQDGVNCVAKARNVDHHPKEGLTAPGVKLYVHRAKWQDSNMRVYSEDEDEEDDDTE